MVILSEAKDLLGVPHVILSEAKDLSLVEEEIPRPFGPRNDKKARILAMTERAQ